MLEVIILSSYCFPSRGKKEGALSKRNSGTFHQIREATTAVFIFCSSVSAQCGGDLTAYSGVIQSPGFPLRYPSEANCEWKIIADDGSRITLTFVDFKV